MRISPVSSNRFNYRNKVNFGKFRDEKTRQHVAKIISDADKKGQFPSCPYKAQRIFEVLDECEFIELYLNPEGKIKHVCDADYLSGICPGGLYYYQREWDLDGADKLEDFHDCIEATNWAIDRKLHPEEYKSTSVNYGPSAEEISQARAEYLAYW